MRRSGLCVLGLFLMNARLYGRAQVPRAVVTKQPNWLVVYEGEAITLVCEIRNGGNIQWQYSWESPPSVQPTNDKRFSFVAKKQHSGRYYCEARDRNIPQATRSDAFQLKVSEKPKPVLTASPSWLSPGDSVLLKCEFPHPPEGWSILWHKSVPNPSKQIYTFKTLPGSSSGTSLGSYIVRGPTHTARYRCIMKRGVYESDQSNPVFVWSAEPNSAATLTVSPNKEQYFFSESVSLSCTGNSAEWTVRRSTDTGKVTYCSSWGTMNRSTCIVPSLQSGHAVYWCESGSGEYSNAVNITVALSRPDYHSFYVPLLSGIFATIVVMILLFLLYRFIKSKHLCSERPTQSQSTNQAKSDNQRDTQERAYSSLHEGDDGIYESMQVSEDGGKDGQTEGYDAAMSPSVQLEPFHPTTEWDDPEANAIYCNVIPQSAANANVRTSHSPPAQGPKIKLLFEMN